MAELVLVTVEEGKPVPVPAEGFLRTNVLTMRRMLLALELMSNRRAPSLDADLKVGACIREIDPLVVPLNVARSKEALRVAEDVLGGQDPEKATEATISLVNMRIKVANDEFDARPVDVKLPRYRITKDDLPKDKAGDKGWENATAIGGIIADLGPLFRMPEEDERRLRGE